MLLGRGTGDVETLEVVEGTPYVLEVLDVLDALVVRNVAVVAEVNEPVGHLLDLTVLAVHVVASLVKGAHLLVVEGYLVAADLDFEDFFRHCFHRAPPSSQETTHMMTARRMR